MKLLSTLIGVLGKRTFWSFAVVTFLMAGLLATVNLASRYALKLYIDDQLERTPWDISISQIGSTDLANEVLLDGIRRVDGVTQIENLALLRAKLPETDASTTVDGKPLTTPWLCLVAASDPSILPPTLHLARVSGDPRHPKPLMGLIGPERAMGSAFLALQGAREFRLNIKSGTGPDRMLFGTELGGVVRLDREELSNWLMDQMGSGAYLPYVGVALLMPYDATVLTRFDSLAMGMIPPELMEPGEAQHVQKAEYIPEIVHLARIDRARLISGWDIGESLGRVAHLKAQIERSIRAETVARRRGGGFRILLVHGPDGQPEAGEPMGEDPKGTSGYLVESTTLILLQRMERTGQLIGVVSLLIALPLLWMGWMLAGNLSGLLMLNERRTLGLMRLRGVPGRTLGQALLTAVAAGGLLGGVAGLIAGSLVPLAVYERGHLPLEVLLQTGQLPMFAGFLVITLCLALLVSRRLVKYATTISPLEASGRVAGSEAARTGVRFGILQALALVLGAAALAGWVYGFSPAGVIRASWGETVGRVLDLLGLPLFLYGITALIASRPALIHYVLGPVFRPLGGLLGSAAEKHMAVKPHRTVAFLLIVALMAAVSLYPTITSRSFEEKAERGAQVQIGSEWQVMFNAPDMAGVMELQGALGQQLGALKPRLEDLLTRVKAAPGVADATYMIEAVLPNFYLPGYGLRGVPLYVVRSGDHYASTAYTEKELGVTEPFDQLIGRLNAGSVLISPPVAEFWEVSSNMPLRVGADLSENSISVPTGGVVAFLPGMSPRTVTDRQGYVQARVDYLNHLFNNNAYVVAAANTPGLATLRAMVPRTILLVRKAPGADPEAVEAAMMKALPVSPLEVHTLRQEVAKVGSDMFVSLALENMRIYLIGGVLLALIAILSVALANYTEDRRTLALIRIRGASPSHIRRFLFAVLMSPALLGLLLGAATAVVAGYGLCNYVWKLRNIRSVVQLLPTHVVLSGLTVAVTLFLLVLVAAAAWLFGTWVFRSTARENISRV